MLRTPALHIKPHIFLPNIPDTTMHTIADGYDFLTMDIMFAMSTAESGLNRPLSTLAQTKRPTPSPSKTADTNSNTCYSEASKACGLASHHEDGPSASDATDSDHIPLQRVSRVPDCCSSGKCVKGPACISAKPRRCCRIWLFFFRRRTSSSPDQCRRHNPCQQP